ncbi:MULTISPECIES: NAD(P)/FAD-dependent oxidoreductase [Marinovum]|uniref:Glycine/D-amino acid oxidase n=2 Tax=Marinovum algicola TaxID=42444 RepID=A0A975ZQ23_9RHOB|nr:FAD-binding oxidoreductase [Marinovum algicola]SEJ99979.1 Glycine/D-amino acid oxidase [Marinovum algicola]SLN73291.1 N-methyl-L-tryptophan oxidase [Marinovum algicola]
MRPWVTTVAGDADLPEAVDLVVIGGGIIGCSAALWAAEQGLRVALLEKGRIAGEQSGRNWGWVRRMGRAAAEYPLGIASLTLWAGLNARIGRDTGFRRCGIVYGAGSAREEAWLDRVEAEARRFGLGVTRLDRAGLADHFPGARLAATTALMTADDGRAEPALAAPALAEGARDAGAAVLTNCAVRGLETEAGRVSAVVTERGVIRCGAAILAAGAWSRLFCGNLGIDLPQVRVRSSVLRTAPVAGGPALALGTGRFGIRPRADGGYTVARRGRTPVQLTHDLLRQAPRFAAGLRQNRREISLTVDRSLIDTLVTPRRWRGDEISPFERCRVLDPAPQDRLLAAALRDVCHSFPALAGVPVRERWGGIIDVTPDGVPVIDQAPGISGLVIATGFSGHGFGLGPGAGQLAAELATGAAPLVDPAPFRLARLPGARRAAAAAGPLHEGA